MNVQIVSGLDVGDTVWAATGVEETAPAFSIIVLVMSAVNIAVGLHSQPIVSLFEKGLELFINIR